MLKALRLTGGVFLDARFTAPWCINSQITAADCLPYLQNPQQVVAFSRAFKQAHGVPPNQLRSG